MKYPFTYLVQFSTGMITHLLVLIRKISPFSTIWDAFLIFPICHFSFSLFLWYFYYVEIFIVSFNKWNCKNFLLWLPDLNKENPSLLPDYKNHNILAQGVLLDSLPPPHRSRMCVLHTKLYVCLLSLLAFLLCSFSLPVYSSTSATVF